MGSACRGTYGEGHAQGQPRCDERGELSNELIALLSQAVLAHRSHADSCAHLRPLHSP